MKIIESKNHKLKTMNDLYGNGSEHLVCEKCEACRTCGDCLCKIRSFLKA